MTGPGCFVIINCGMPKGSANGLSAMYANGNMAMRCAAATMRDKLDEVCRFGAAITGAAVPIDQDDLARIYNLRAKQLGLDIDAYVIANSKYHSFEDLDENGRALLGRIRVFTAVLTAVFEDIVAEYGPQIEGGMSAPFPEPE